MKISFKIRNSNIVAGERPVQNDLYTSRLTHRFFHQSEHWQNEWRENQILSYAQQLKPIIIFSRLNIRHWLIEPSDTRNPRHCFSKFVFFGAELLLFFLHIFCFHYEYDIVHVFKWLGFYLKRNQVFESGSKNDWSALFLFLLFFFLLLFSLFTIVWMNSNKNASQFCYVRNSCGILSVEILDDMFCYKNNVHTSWKWFFRYKKSSIVVFCLSFYRSTMWAQSKWTQLVIGRRKTRRFLI